jgi:branched-subunit amino acid ABC-type transport system permease component
VALVVQVVVTGLAAGAVYGLVAQGYALVYQLTGVVHLALGEFVGLSVFTTLAVAGGTSTDIRRLWSSCPGPCRRADPVQCRVALGPFLTAS